MKDLIVIALLLLIVGAAASYVYREKKRGNKCIGCPHGSACSGKCSGGCGGDGHKTH